MNTMPKFSTYHNTCYNLYDAFENSGLDPLPQNQNVCTYLAHTAHDQPLSLHLCSDIYWHKTKFPGYRGYRPQFGYFSSYMFT